MATDEIDLTTTADQARAQLDEAAARGRQARTDAPVGARYTALLGVLVAVLLAVVALVPNGVGLAVTMCCFTAVLGALIGWQQQRFRIASRGWGRRYGWGFGLTMVLYSGGIFWQAFSFPGWLVFAPYCVLVCVPSLVAAVGMVRSASAGPTGSRVQR